MRRARITPSGCVSTVPAARPWQRGFLASRSGLRWVRGQCAASTCAAGSQGSRASRARAFTHHPPTSPSRSPRMEASRVQSGVHPALRQLPCVRAHSFSNDAGRGHHMESVPGSPLRKSLLMPEFLERISRRFQLTGLASVFELRSTFASECGCVCFRIGCERRSSKLGAFRNHLRLDPQACRSLDGRGVPVARRLRRR